MNSFSSKVVSGKWSEAEFPENTLCMGISGIRASFPETTQKSQELLSIDLWPTSLATHEQELRFLPQYPYVID